MGRPVELPEEPAAKPGRPQLGALRRAVLERVALDSPAYREHAARLRRARNPEARLRVYEATLRKAVA